MADSKISALADGGPAQPLDELVIARSGANNKLDVEDLVGVQNQVATDVTVVNTTTETSIYSYSVPAATLDTNRLLRLTIFGDILANSGTPNLTVRVKFGGTTIYADATANFSASATRRPFFFQILLAGDGATNAQVLGGWLFVGAIGTATTGTGDLGVDENQGVAPIANTAALDQTSAQTLDVTVQWSAANASVECRAKHAVLERL